MKKLFFALACLVSVSTLASSEAMAQTTKTKIKTKPATAATKPTGAKVATASAASTAAGLGEYVGKYKFEGLPFEFLTITLADGKLSSSNGEEPTVLTPMKEADNFDNGGKAVLIFTRSADKKVNGVTIDAQGMQFEGAKVTQ